MTATVRTTAVPAGTMLRIYSFRLIDDTAQVFVLGEIDLANAGQLRDCLLAAVGAGAHRPDLMVDLGNVTFLDATGVSALVEAAVAARRAGIHLTVRNPRGLVRRILEITGVAARLDVPGSHGAWHTGHQYELRPARPARRTSVPQTRQDWPARR
jgi:anti-anti-sigma factor